jgi:hypothetical protein
MLIESSGNVLGRIDSHTCKSHLQGRTDTFAAAMNLVVTSIYRMCRRQRHITDPRATKFNVAGSGTP